MTQKAIGPSFSDELAAHSDLIGQHFTWSPDGTIEFFEDTPQTVVDSVLAVYESHDPSKPAMGDLKSQARVALDGSDVTVLRCAESAIPVPPAWIKYRKTLREIVGGAVQPLPAQPPYPAGT